MHTHTHRWQTHKHEAKDALIRCMVKKYIYWNLCQCRKNWKLALGFVTVPQVNIPAGACWAETKPASLFGAVHLLPMATEKVAYGGLWHQTHRLTDTEKLGRLLRHTTSKCTRCTAINRHQCSLVTVGCFFFCCDTVTNPFPIIIKTGPLAASIQGGSKELVLCDHQLWAAVF